MGGAFVLDYKSPLSSEKKGRLRFTPIILFHTANIYSPTVILAQKTQIMEMPGRLFL